MGLSVKGVTSSVSKAISKATKPVSKAISGATKNVGDLAKAASKGDIKGAASAVGGLTQTAKDIGKDLASQNLGIATGALGALGSATGSRDISGLASNISREGNKGIETYGDTAMDIGANVATGGTYGAAQGALGSLQQGGLSGLLDPKRLQQQALSAGASYAGINPAMLQSTQSALSGDLKGAALQGLGSYGGLSDTQLSLASGLASGKSVEELAKQQALAKGRGIASDAAGAYAQDLGLDKLQKDLQSKFKGIDVRKLPGAANVQKINEQLAKTQQRYSPTGNKTLKQIAAETGISVQDLLKNNPQLKNANSKIAAGQEIFLQPTMEEPGFFEKAWGGIKEGASKLPGAVSSGLGKVRDFAAENKELLGTGAQAGAAYMGYKAGEKGYDEAKKLVQQQLKETQGAGKQFASMSFDPNRYKQEREFLQQRIAGQGYTAEEKKMQQEGDIRAARAAAAQRLSGLETQARLGGSGVGTSALAAALSGAQGSQNIQSEANLAREASAQQKMEQALQRKGGLSTQQTQEEANLAQSQGVFDLNRLQQVGASRGELGNIALGRASALQNLYGRGADLATGMLSRMEAPQPQQQPQQAPQPEQQPQQNLYVKAGAANRLANRQPQQAPQQQQNQPARNQFNTKNLVSGVNVKNPKAAPKQIAQNVAKAATDTAKNFVEQNAGEAGKKALGLFGVKF